MNTKKLTQAVFDGLPAEYIYSSVDADGEGYVYEIKPTLNTDVGRWLRKNSAGGLACLGRGYDPTNWKNSLIERAADPITALCDKRVDADLTHHTPTAQDKHIDELINRLAQRDLDVARLNRQINAAAARIENHVAQHVEYERYIKELDAKCQSLTAQLMTDPAPSNAYDDHKAHQEFIDGLGRGAKYTVVLLAAMAVIAFLMTMGWVGGAV